MRTDLHYVLSGGFFLSLTQVSSAIIGLVLTTAFANLLPVETYGTYRYILSLYALFTIAAMPGLDTAVMQSVARGYDRTYPEGLRVRLRWGFLGTLAAIVYAVYLFAQGSAVMGWLLIIAGVALPFMESGAMYSTYLNATKRYRTWAILDIIGQICSAIILIGTITLSKNIFLLLIAYFVPYILTRWGSTWFLLRRVPTDGNNDPDVRTYSKSLTLFQIVSRITASIDQIVLYHFLGATQVAIFALATAIPMRVQSIFRISGTLAFPKFAGKSEEEIVATLPRRMLLFALGIFVVCIAYVLAAPYLFKLLFPKYLPSLPFSQIAVFYTLSAITYPFAIFLNAHKKIRENYAIAISSFFAKVGCLLVFVPIFGIWGAVIGLLAGSMTTIFISVWYLYSIAQRSVTTPFSVR